MCENFLTKIDLVSPPISLFYRGLPSHSSWPSGVLTILGLALLLFFCGFQLKYLFNRESEIPISTSFTYFIEDAGTLSLNSSSLFHFISLEDFNDKGNEEFYFSYFNIIGLQDSFAKYEKDNNIYNYDHWLYGYCNRESDIKGVEDIATQKFLTKSACIRKYYNSETKSYYDTNDPNFKWPSLSHGIFHQENRLYTIIIKSCEQYILDHLFNGEMACKDIKDFDFSTMLAHLNFMDHYIDVLNYEHPIGNYFYKIENKLDEENYSINHLNFNPSLIRSNKGYVLEKKIEESTINYFRNDALIYKKIRLYIAYSFYLNNRINFYERTYQKVQDILSSIGGISNIISFILKLINSYINSYDILFDLIYLLNFFSISIGDIKSTDKRNIINKKLQQIENIKRHSKLFSKPNKLENIPKDIEEMKNYENTEKNELKETIPNQTLNTEKSEGKESPKSSIHKNNEKSEVNQDNKEKEKDLNSNIFNLCYFLLYKITFGKKYKNLEIYENFYKKIISVENLIENYLTMNKLIDMNKNISKIT